MVVQQLETSTPVTDYLVFLKSELDRGKITSAQYRAKLQEAFTSQREIARYPNKIPHPLEPNIIPELTS